MIVGMWKAGKKTECLSHSSRVVGNWRFGVSNRQCHCQKLRWKQWSVCVSLLLLLCLSVWYHCVYVSLCASNGLRPSSLFPALLFYERVANSRLTQGHRTSIRKMTGVWQGHRSLTQGHRTFCLYQAMLSRWALVFSGCLSDYLWLTAGGDST